MFRIVLDLLNFLVFIGTALQGIG